MEKPKKSDSCTADHAEEEFPVAMLRISKFVHQDFGASYINESTSG
jgi:hypothetical protein